MHHLVGPKLCPGGEWYEYQRKDQGGDSDHWSLRRHSYPTRHGADSVAPPHQAGGGVPSSRARSAR